MYNVHVTEPMWNLFSSKCQLFFLFLFFSHNTFTVTVITKYFLCSGLSRLSLCFVISFRLFIVLDILTLIYTHFSIRKRSRHLTRWRGIVHDRLWSWAFSKRTATYGSCSRRTKVCVCGLVSVMYYLELKPPPWTYLCTRGFRVAYIFRRAPVSAGVNHE